VLAVSQIGYRVLQLAGAAYMLWLGVGMLRTAIRSGPSLAPVTSAAGSPSAPDGARGWF
jgi:threonine/homoserine/homoserine lactone efflux protein